MIYSLTIWVYVNVGKIYLEKTYTKKAKTKKADNSWLKKKNGINCGIYFKNFLKKHPQFKKNLKKFKKI